MKHQTTTTATRCRKAEALGTSGRKFSAPGVPSLFFVPHLAPLEERVCLTAPDNLDEALGEVEHTEVVMGSVVEKDEINVGDIEHEFCITLVDLLCNTGMMLDKGECFLFLGQENISLTNTS
ncbi:hypothetical protein GN956_G15864 [Arapaima gigas]